MKNTAIVIVAALIIGVLAYADPNTPEIIPVIGEPNTPELVSVAGVPDPGIETINKVGDSVRVTTSVDVTRLSLERRRDRLIQKKAQIDAELAKIETRLAVFK